MEAFRIKPGGYFISKDRWKKNCLIYVTGERNGDGYLSSTVSWTTLASMNESKMYFQTEGIDGNIYAIGGSRTASYIEAYSVAAGNPEASPILKASGGNSKIDLTWARFQILK